MQHQASELSGRVGKLDVRDQLNTDAIASLSDQVIKLMKDIEVLKKNTITTRV